MVTIYKFFSVLFFLLITNYGFGQITVYSMASGNVTTPGIWSTTGPSGPACPCGPTILDSVVISHNIVMNVGFDVKSLTVVSGGTFDHATNVLRVYDGTYEVQSGGITTHTGNGRLDFMTGYCTWNVMAGSTFLLEDVKTFLIDSLQLIGSGTIDIEDDFVIQSTQNAVVRLDHTGTFNLLNSWSSFMINGPTFNVQAYNSGIINIGDDFRFNGPSSSFVNMGTLNVADNLDITGGNSNTLINTGNIVVMDDMRFLTDSNTINNKTGGTITINAASSFKGLSYQGDYCNTINSGTITITSSLLRCTSSAVLGSEFTNNVGGILNIGLAFQLRDAPFVFDNYGTVNLNGRFDDMAGTEFIYNRAGAVWNYNGIHNPALNAEIEFYANFGVNEFNYMRNDGALQEVFACIDAYSNVTFTGSGVKRLENNIDVNGNLAISGTAILDADDRGYDITLAGNWTNTSIFTEGNELVTLDGVADQTIIATGGETFYNWTINKTLGKVIMANNIDVDNVLTLTSGACDMNTNTLSINLQSSGAIVQTNGSIISENTGNLSKLVRNVGTTVGSYLFPFCTADELTYIPFTLELTAGDMGNVTMSTYPTGSNNLPWPTAPIAVTNLIGVALPVPDNRDFTIDRFWQIDKSGASGTANITFSYSQGEATASIIGVEALLNAQRYESSTNTWNLPLPGQVTNDVNNTVFVPGVTSFSPWTLSLTSSPLPITLTNFNAILNDEAAEITWATSSQINNDFFTLEKSRDAKNFTPFLTVDGAGTNNAIIDYFEIDYELEKGTTYYRLKQTDFDGQYTYSNIVPVVYSGETITAFQVYPNPAQWDKLKVKINGGEKEDILIIIRDLQGKECYSKLIRLDEGSNEYALKPQYELAPDTYIIIGSSSNNLFNSKLIITK